MNCVVAEFALVRFDVLWLLPTGLNRAPKPDVATPLSKGCYSVVAAYWCGSVFDKDRRGPLSPWGTREQGSTSGRFDRLKLVAR